MRTFGAFLVSLVATGGMAAALPAANKQTASVKVTYNTGYVAHGPSALYKAYKKYSIPISSELAAAADTNKTQSPGKRRRASTATGSATNTPTSDDGEYLTAVSIGTPAQVLNLDFDTGSSDLWVFSTETTSSEVNGQTLYNPGQSSTAQQLNGYTWDISYGDKSSSSGDVYTDIVTVGGISFASQAVESAHEVSDQFSQDSQNDGLLGLAFDAINTVQPTQQKTWFSNVAPTLQQQLFTANLNHQADGTYNFGYIDTTEAKGQVAYTPVDSSQGWWGFTSPGYAIGSGSVNSHSLSGIADTGTTLLLLDDTVVDAYWAQVKGAQVDQQQGGYTYPCSETLPTFTFGVGSSTITISSELLAYASDGETCFGGLQSNGGIGINIFGDIALKAALVVFDLGNNQLGWAQK